MNSLVKNTEFSFFTTHLIFPAPIRYVKLGSDYLIADKATGAENVLRVKAATTSFTTATNLSLITEDERFYNFDITYNPTPVHLSFDISRLLFAQSSTDFHHTAQTNILFADTRSEDLGGFGDTVTANWYYDYFKKAGKKIVFSFMIYRPHQSPSYSFQYTNKITKENIRIIKNISDLYERINEYRLK